jgi:hypothetical protein
LHEFAFGQQKRGNSRTIGAEHAQTVALCEHGETPAVCGEFELHDGSIVRTPNVWGRGG